jgi:hypothetical protein
MVSGYWEKKNQIISEINLVNKIRLLPLHPIQKMGGKKSRKIFESLEATARKSSIYGKVMLANTFDKDVNFQKRLKSVSKLIYNGEFDPGSG